MYKAARGDLPSHATEDLAVGSKIWCGGQRSSGPAEGIPVPVLSDRIPSGQATLSNALPSRAMRIALPGIKAALPHALHADQWSDTARH